MPETAKIDGREQAKKNAHKDQAAAAGHNSEKAGGEVDQATFLMYVGQQKTLDEQIGALKAKRNRLRRSAKNEGIVLGDMDAMIRLEGIGDEAIEEHFRNRIRYARYMRLPVGTQLGFFDEEQVVEKTGPDKAHDDGRAAGLLGNDLDSNPHEMNTEAGQKWAEGWHEGQKELAEQLKMREGSEGPLQ